MDKIRIGVVGGGAAGIFGAIAAAEAHPAAQVTVFEKGRAFLAKVRISGGGRCNVTHALFEPREFCQRYPRGGKALRGPFSRFQARDTVAWFEARGIPLKAEDDGRMFPTTDDSRTIVDGLLAAAREAGVVLVPGVGVESVAPQPDGTFRLGLGEGRVETVDRVLLATGGARSNQMLDLFRGLGHAVAEPVPSLFTFHVELPWLRELSGVSVPEVSVSVPGTRLKEKGPLLVTHWGLSGPAILKLSAWGARELHACDYRFNVEVDWLPSLTEQALGEEFQLRRQEHPAKTLGRFSIPPVPARLWENLLAAAGIDGATRWAEVPKAQLRSLTQQLKRSTFPVREKSLYKEEFVTCGGVNLKEVNFKTMESRLVPGLYFAGEALDIDGLTGGFNFQSAWTTGWIAGQSMAAG